MSNAVRTAAPYLFVAGGLAAAAWAVSFKEPPRADFTFVNGTEVKSVDPALITGAPEGRIVNALFEGLFGVDPETAAPVPGAAEKADVSADQSVYTFHLRPTARWSDGSPVTAHDFLWSWRRTLHPETASEYAYQLHYVKNGEAYNQSQLEVDSPVEIELPDRPVPGQQFPSGTMLKGTLRKIVEPPKDSEAAKVFEVEIDGKTRRFSTEPAAGVEHALWVLPDFDQVGVQAVDDRTLVVTLKSPTPYFLNLAAFYPLFPVHRPTIEKHGFPAWTKPENLVGNGAYRLLDRRVRDRIRLVKSDTYWDASNVSLEVIDALAVNSETTALNMYLNGQVDWATSPPTSIIPLLKLRDDYMSTPMLTVYFYRLNTKRKPLDDPRVRRALNLGFDKSIITDQVLKSGQIPARGFVPSGLPGYQQAQAGEFNIAEAKRLLAEAGYPDGRGMPPIEILFNTHEAHKTIAEVVQNAWKNNLGVDARLANQEWQAFLATTREGKYSAARAGWIGDYPDPNTFLDMFVTDGPQNQTGWSNAEYDRLIRASALEGDPKQRMAMLHQAERILMDEQPLIPIYFYVSINMVRPYVHGFFPNNQDLHPLHKIRVDPAARDLLLNASGAR